MTATTNAMRRTARAAGALYLLTFVSSIPTLSLYEPVRNHADFIRGAGSDTTVRWGASLEVVLAIACVGTAVILFPVAKRQSETAALGFLAARVIEAALILVGVVSVLVTLTLRGNVATAGASAGASAGATEGALTTFGQALGSVYDWTFLLGQSLMPVISAICLGTVLYRSRLVPRVIPLIGLCGAPLLLASDVAILWGAYAQRSVVAGLAALPIAAWELALGVYLVTKGFRPSPILQDARPDARPA